ncbi:DMT family transporter [Echinimonas agarilytica]|uniref:DMT family transporter n=1 Tax=Echinimonas agarilytica TaxID=1215918 RepID=A0AA42B8J6_9GAMM|nr:DMT family transporter [Echinimonas agarilytica]MCM2680291.1 DMT family transporter [Echinimonas agarilytica]
MKKLTVGSAMGLLILGNVIAVFSDALIKVVANDVAVFQFVFFRQLAAVLILIPFCLSMSKKSLWEGLKWHVLRGHIWLLGAVFMVVAIGSMPLATANAIFYAAPLMMLPLAMLLFKEKLSKTSCAAAVLGFAGVLVIIRPSELDWAAISALVVALTLAMNNLLVRKLPTHQTVPQTLMLTNLVGIPASAALMLWEGTPMDWSVFPMAAGSSSFIMIYAATCVIAYRSIESNKIASAEYSGLLGAVAVGLIMFNEVPDWFMVVGTALIIVPMLIIARRKSDKVHSES